MKKYDNIKIQEPRKELSDSKPEARTLSEAETLQK